MYTYWLAFSTCLSLVSAATSYGNISSYPASTVAASNLSSAYGLDSTSLSEAGSTLLSPWLAGYSATWSQFYTPAILGTVHIIISSNTTRTVTSTNSDVIGSTPSLVTNGTLFTFTRTDINAAGTVTAYPTLPTVGVPAHPDTEVKVTYPTPAFIIDQSISWFGYVPLTSRGSVVCWQTTYESAIPSHAAFSTIAQQTDTADPSGWFYELVVNPVTYVGSKNLSALLSPASIPSQYASCNPNLPHSDYQGAHAYNPVVPVQPVGGLLATSTVSITSSATIPITSVAPASPAQSVSSSGASPTFASETSNQPTLGTPASNSVPVPTNSPAAVISSDAETSSGSSVVSSSQADTAPIVPVQVSSPSAGGSSVTHFTAEAQSTAGSSSPVIIHSISPYTGANSVGATVSPSYGGLLSAIGSLFGSDSTQTTPVTHTESTVATSGTSTPVISDHSTIVLHQQPASLAETDTIKPTIVVGSITATENSASQYEISGQPLTPGNPITIGSGSSHTVVALTTAASHTLLIVGSSTSTIGGTPPLPANTASQYVVSGETLTPGHSITLGSGTLATVVALEMSGSQTLLVIDGSTSPIANAAPITTPAPIIVGSATITPNSYSEYIISSRTLTPGGEVTISGTRYSLASDATELVVGSSTEVLTSEPGLATYIWSGLGGSGLASQGSSTLNTGTSNGVVSSNATPATSGVTSATVPATSRSPSVANSSATNVRAHNWLCLVVMPLLVLLFV